MPLAVEQDFRDVVQDGATAGHGKPYFGPENPKTGSDYAIKDYDSLKEKIENRKGGDPSGISDAIRGTVIVPELSDLKIGLDATVQSIEERGGKVLQIEDKYANPMETGYVGIHVDAAFPTPDGGMVRAEIQVHDHNFDYKENSHEIYLRNRKGEISTHEMIIGTVDMYNQWYQEVSK